ncbi:hypothetical protein HIM_12029 [Hirsutella minnesotensis 3608]|uniref:Uncharacterized protein n=1 Tax=Hirsutella minnesotensis 3608 TaxID=1043627 RepID=A0A0F7ZW95_9HYPO|nr:hypothetical protein HIM_12029 [Hirsutella minnesotensis 3608]
MARKPAVAGFLALAVLCTGAAPSALVLPDDISPFVPACGDLQSASDVQRAATRNPVNPRGHHGVFTATLVLPPVRGGGPVSFGFIPPSAEHAREDEDRAPALQVDFSPACRQHDRQHIVGHKGLDP